MSQHSTHILLKAFNNGDPAAFDRVFKLFYPSLRYFADKLMDHHPEAEDLVCDVFKKLWEIRATFTDYSSIKAFLYIATKNNCLNKIKSIGRQRRRHEAIINNTDDIMESSERLLIEAETIQIIYNKVQKLPKKCRKVFMMTYFQGYTSQEIMKELNISMSTVTSQRAYAIMLLRKELPPEQFGLILLLIGGPL